MKDENVLVNEKMRDRKVWINCANLEHQSGVDGKVSGDVDENR